MSLFITETKLKSVLSIIFEDEIRNDYSRGFFDGVLFERYDEFRMDFLMDLKDSEVI